MAREVINNFFGAAHLIEISLSDLLANPAWHRRELKAVGKSPNVGGIDMVNLVTDPNHWNVIFFK